jgi:hypothetical protein
VLKKEKEILFQAANIHFFCVREEKKISSSSFFGFWSSEK